MLAFNDNFVPPGKEVLYPPAPAPLPCQPPDPPPPPANIKKSNSTGAAPPDVNPNAFAEAAPRVELIGITKSP
jgi:hypothetical protein